MVGGDRTSVSSSVFSSNAGRGFRSSILAAPKYIYRFPVSLVPSSISPICRSSVLCSSPFPLGLVAFSSSSAGAPKFPSPNPNEFPPPPPINPPETVNPDPATLREQWRYATRMYSRWYGHAWGTAILAGVSFYALGWWIKGENPLTEKGEEHKKEGK